MPMFRGQKLLNTVNFEGDSRDLAAAPLGGSKINFFLL